MAKNRLTELMDRAGKLRNELAQARKNTPEAALAAELQTVEGEIEQVRAEDDRRQVAAWAVEIEQAGTEAERALIDYARGVYAQLDAIEEAIAKANQARALAARRPDELSAARAGQAGRILARAHDGLIAWLFALEHGSPELQARTGAKRRT